MRHTYEETKEVTNMPSEFEPSVLQFMRDRNFLKNTTDKTQQWYNSAFRAFQGCHTQQEYEQRIVELRERGIAAISCNSWITAVNVYQRWRVEQKLTPPGESFKLSKLKTEQKALATFTANQVSKLLGYKAKSATMKRLRSL